MKLHEKQASALLTWISTELMTEDKTHRFFALQWLWDYVSVHAKGDKVKLTPGQLAILD
jgi:hypothetical protein